MDANLTQIDTGKKQREAEELEQKIKLAREADENKKIDLAREAEEKKRVEEKFQEARKGDLARVDESKREELARADMRRQDDLNREDRQREDLKKSEENKLSEEQKTSEKHPGQDLKIGQDERQKASLSPEQTMSRTGAGMHQTDMKNVLSPKDLAQAETPNGRGRSPRSMSAEDVEKERAHSTLSAENRRFSAESNLLARMKLRNQEKSIENEASGKVTPPGRTVEVGKQSEANVQASQEARQIKTQAKAQEKTETQKKELGLSA